MMRATLLGVAVAAALFPRVVWSADAALPKPVVERILDTATADAAKIGPLENCVAVTPDGVAVVGDGQRLWLAGASGARASAVRGLSSFAFTPEGLLVGVRGRELVYLGSDGTLKKFFTLPGAGMSVAPGAGDSLLLFGPEGKGRYGLFLIRPGRRVTKVGLAEADHGRRPVRRPRAAGGRRNPVRGARARAASGGR